ncbi:uncharacterized protein LOC115904541 [Camarhynchus parvulus]|uniref:uncharacterized protein LOC115904541 n=1 Tax=Geospiza parvula TaxID=87175 RepID=UPI0012383717|nr:uncharacterized protein LOC115904541 [Camarhynchus parvulus]
MSRGQPGGRSRSPGGRCPCRAPSDLRRGRPSPYRPRGRSQAVAAGPAPHSPRQIRHRQGATGGSVTGRCPAFLGLATSCLPGLWAQRAAGGRGAAGGCVRKVPLRTLRHLPSSLPSSFLPSPPPPSADENKQRRWRRRWRRHGAARGSEGSGSPGPAPAAGRASPPALTLAARPPGPGTRRSRGSGRSPGAASGLGGGGRGPGAAGLSPCPVGARRRRRGAAAERAPQGMSRRAASTAGPAQVPRAPQGRAGTSRACGRPFLGRGL